MAFKNLVLLAPCHGIEDFPLYHTGDDAASLLAGWTSLWHPYLLANAKRLPRVERCDYPPEELSETLFVLPKACESELAEELPDEIEAHGSKLVRGDTVSRGSIIKRALEGIDAPEIDIELVRDFMALGFALLQVELLTQQMRYASSIDQSRVERLVFESAKLAVEGNVEACHEKLRSCHDALADERSHYYPVDVYLLDLTLIAESTLTPALTSLLQDETPANVLATGKCIEKLAEKFPAALAALRSGIEQKQIGIAGGEYEELPLPLTSPDSFVQQLELGRQQWQQHVGQSPRVFARRRAGIYPGLAWVIQRAGFDAALHMKFDEGKYPESAQSKTKWCVNDRPVIDCLARQPMSANAHHTFLDLPRELSDAMDTDFVAVRAFWHWPGHVVPWYRDLRRACRFGSALGKFVTLEEFFEESSAPHSNDTFTAASYRYPFLNQAAKAKDSRPNSNGISFWQKSVQEMCDGHTRAMASLLGEERNGEDPIALLEQAMIRSGAKSSNSKKTVINPLPFPRRICVEGVEGSGEKVYASESIDGNSRTLVDVPAMGFTTFNLSQAKPITGPNLAEELTLRNEYFQATIDEVTGSLRTFRDYKSRTTLLSQQVGLRITIPKTGQHWVDRQAPVGYSVMASDSTRVTANGKVFAEITAEGRMLAPNGEQVGEFIQRYQVFRGSRILSLEIEIKPREDLLLEDEPWDSYYTSRFAFGDESAVLVAGRHLQAIDVGTRRFEAPLFVGIDCASQVTSVLCGGIPHHRRATASQLDTILITAGEQETKFRLGIGVDLPSPVHSAVGWMADNCVEPQLIDREVTGGTGWLAHVSAKNVLVSSATPNEQGVRFRLVETSGRGTKFRIHGVRSWQSFDRVDLHGNVTQAAQIEDGVAVVSLDPYEASDWQATS